nr:MAG: major capsid protein [Microviridae sp.]
MLLHLLIRSLIVGKVYNRVGSLNPGRSVFNLSYEKKLTGDFGKLYPIMCDEVVPGDIMTLGNEVVIRFTPLVAPILHEINCYIHYFFVPYRLLWDEWEDFITGGSTGASAAVLPLWHPTNPAGSDVNSLWDYLGFPIWTFPVAHAPLDFPRRAYNRIYNVFYRDETLIAEVAETNEQILKRAWEKDYFTSALPWQQRGVAPALPISGTSHAIFPSANFIGPGGTTGEFGFETGVNHKAMLLHNMNAQMQANAKAFFDDNTVNLGAATTFNVADLRLAFQVQKWLERNARAGARYTEFLQSHFGVSPRDDRLQRPEYIGGSKSPIIISEVLQTSQSDTTPQGNLAGHGITVDRQFCGKYRATEFGLIMGIMSVMPRTVYTQGLNRQWLRRTKYDFYFPEFANLSEQAIETAEIYTTSVDAQNATIFGYQGRYDEMRVKQSQVVAGMRSLFDYWHMARQFGSAPILNQSFIECVDDKRCFAVTDEHVMIINVANLIKAVRPMPIMSNPGFIDH